MKMTTAHNTIITKKAPSEDEASTIEIYNVV